MESKERTVRIDDGGDGGFITSRFGFVKVRMKDNVGATTGGPTDAYGVTPALIMPKIRAPAWNIQRSVPRT